MRRTSCAGACAVACVLAVAPVPTAGFLASPMLARSRSERHRLFRATSGCFHERERERESVLLHTPSCAGYPTWGRGGPLPAVSDTSTVFRRAGWTGGVLVAVFDLGCGFGEGLPRWCGFEVNFRHVGRDRRVARNEVYTAVGQPQHLVRSGTIELRTKVMSTTRTYFCIRWPSMKRSWLM